jgi:hypothetical protein
VRGSAETAGQGRIHLIVYLELKEIFLKGGGGALPIEHKYGRELLSLLVYFIVTNLFCGV